MFGALLTPVGVRVLHEECLGVGRGCGTAFGYKRYRCVFTVGVEEEMGKRGAEECPVYAAITARRGCVDIVAIGAVKLNSVYAGHV